ncbi:MAG: NUDIX hydrolase [Candidatus Taylorbacteria bacterium]|nr:NUDIX hydrolase [Candidatus Taylorbacteria bacterium]
MGIGKPSAQKPVVAGAIFFDNKGRILIVKPTYKDNWNMPGGAVEEKESPIRGCMREIKEELGFDWPNLKLIAVDYIGDSAKPSWGDAIRFLFYGGTLSDGEIANIKLPAEELQKFEFVDPAEARKKLSPHTGTAVTAALEALRSNKIVYLEDGVNVL